MEPEQAALFSNENPPPRRRAIRDVISWTLSTALGVTFLLSAVGKALSISDFQWTFRDFGYNRFFSFLSAHGLVALELIIGMYLLMQFRLRRITLPLVFFFLLLFSGYLGYVLYWSGNEGDCGCFGALAAMTPLAALIKNGIMLIAAVGLWLTCRPARRTLRLSATLLAPLLLAAGAFFIPARLDISPLYKTAGEQKPAVDLSRGKHVVAFMSLTCSHCREAAKRFKAMHDSDAGLPLFMVLSGRRDAMEDFFADTQAEDVPHSYFGEPKAFVKMAGRYVPVIMLLDNSRLDDKVYYKDLKMAELRRWAAE